MLAGSKIVPSGPLTIDWSHPLTKDLIACYVPGVMGGINIANPGLADLGQDTAGDMFGVGIEGPALTSVVNSSALAALAPASFKGLSRVSLYYRGQCLGNSANSQTLFGSAFSSPTNLTPFAMYVLTAGTTGTTGNGLTFVFNSGGVLKSIALASSTQTVGRVISFGGAMIAGGTSVAYMNGVKNATTLAGGASAPTSGASTPIGINAFWTGQANNANANAFLGCMWARTLSDDEWAYLDQNPYCFLTQASLAAALSLEAASAEVTWPGAKTKKRRQITLGEVIAMEQRELGRPAKQEQTELKTERHEAAEPEAPAPDDGLIKSLIAMPPSEIQIAPLTQKQINSRLRQQEEEEMALLLVLAN